MFTLYKSSAQTCTSRLSVFLVSSFSKKPKYILTKSLQSSSSNGTTNNNGSSNQSKDGSNVNSTHDTKRTIYEPQKTFTNSTKQKMDLTKINDTSVIGKGVELLDGFESDGVGGKRLTVRGYNDNSFLVNDILIENQSIILFPSTMILWNGIREVKDITIESLSVFTLVYPTIEILFIGCGETMLSRFPVEICKYFRDKGIVIEATDTANAAATFNVLNSEGRNVGAALLTLVPSSYDDITTTDMFMRDLK